MITCTYCGKENDGATARCRGCGTELPSRPASETPPAPGLIDCEALEGAFAFKDGFHRVDWDFIWRWVDAHVGPEDRQEACSEAAMLWVSKLRDDLGGNYSVVVGRQTVLLSDQPPETVRWLLDYASSAAETIKRHLGEIAWAGTFGKDLVLAFSDLDDFYQYISFHSPDGEQAATGGVCIYSGYTHIAIPWHDQQSAANTIVHELAHDCLAHLNLPRWLDEGIAVTLEKAIAAATARPIMEDELAERHFDFWTEQNIQSFWAGTSFYEPGDANELSYSLAEVLLKLLRDQSNREGFWAFVESAHPDDAGQTAALDVLGIDLGELAGTFLGEGNWRPQRKAMAACREAAGWNRPREESSETAGSNETEQ